MKTTIALIGDYRKEVVAHGAIPHALELANAALNTKVTWAWVETSTLSDNIAAMLEKYSAIWVTPGSPYANMEGVIQAIRFSRESNRPLLGTCGGFQHALIEYARNVCGIQHSDHAESNPTGDTLIITRLTCSLVGTTGQISFRPGSHLNTIFKGQPTTEKYSCNYGLNPKWKDQLETKGLDFTGVDSNGEIRAFELTCHPFFIGTLFQPERSALEEKQHPLIQAFITSVLKYSQKK